MDDELEARIAAEQALETLAAAAAEACAAAVGSIARLRDAGADPAALPDTGPIEAAGEALLALSNEHLANLRVLQEHRA